MKQIIIFLLAIILLIIGYSKYKQYKRFTPQEYEYQASKDIDLNYHNKSFLLDYYQSIEALNGYVIMQWSNENMDVRNPEDDNEETKAAMAIYAKKLGEVKYYEAQLMKSAELKKEGLNNDDIKMLENKEISAKDYANQQESIKSKKLFIEMFKAETEKNKLRIGRRSAFVFELQKKLVAKGYDIPVDGVYMNVTAEAISQFEEKNGLFPDGIIDALTLEKLLN